MPAVTILLAAVILKAYNEVAWPVIEKAIDRAEGEKKKEKTEEVKQE